MEVYRLTHLGYRLSHNIRHEEKPEWGVIYYLSRMHVATKEKILSEVPGTSPSTLAKLRIKKVIVEESGVDV